MKTLVEKMIWTAIAIRVVVILGFLALGIAIAAFVSCCSVAEASKLCKPDTLQCRENTLIACNDNHDWVALTDCANDHCRIVDDVAGCYLSGGLNDN
jgi:hypothetical protein